MRLGTKEGNELCVYQLGIGKKAKVSLSICGFDAEINKKQAMQLIYYLMGTVIDERTEP